MKNSTQHTPNVKLEKPPKEKTAQQFVLPIDKQHNIYSKFVLLLFF
jgi:hypothetical protein